jgi:tetratricopeptide (TPR) repeat protein
VETRPVLRIFISSTAIDLTDFRTVVRDAVLRLENLPIQMETFSAQPGQPLVECTRMAAESAAVICIVAHRYGYVPPVELGGDGERSITWLEVEAAKSAGKPVFAFLVDPKAPWTAQKEQDRIVDEPEKAAEIVKAIQKLKEFKEYLSRERTHQYFTDPHHLEAQVTAALYHLRPETVYATTRVWQPLFCHALQPAQHFRGRSARLDELRKWLESPVTPDRVVSVVAAGGTGKTALVHEALRQAKFDGRSGLFVWSFYEDPHTDAFLRAAYLYFTGDKETPTAGLLERLQIALSGDARHVLVLDGLERVQNEEGHRRRGELEDFQLKRLVKGLAGGLGNARAVVTSRFPLVDLDEWKGAGHRAIMLDDLERSIALDVLRAWGVKGNDDALSTIIEPLKMGGSYHALSVAALGSYLGNFDGPAPEFSLDDAKESDPKARRLHRILDQYAAVLTAPERDLLARLSLFPRGVKVELLGWIVQAGGDVAGALIGLSDHQLVTHLERLKQLGLVFRYETDRQFVYSAHPFVRDFFRHLLGTRPESVHESVRARLAPSLEARPKTPPEDPTILDRYELLIEQTLLSGRMREAFDLYLDGLGGYDSFRWTGDSTRGLRILERFASNDDFSQLKPNLVERRASYLIASLGLFSKNLGDLARARKAFNYALSIDEESGDQLNQSINSRNLADLELPAGCFPRALQYADRSVSHSRENDDKWRIASSLCARAAAHTALGDNQNAEADFARATEIEQVLYSLRGFRENEFKYLRGYRQQALVQTEANRTFAADVKRRDDLCQSDTLLARLLLPDDAARAGRHLQDARTFATRAGHIELQLHCFISGCELQRHLGDYAQSVTEAESGILLADTCGFGKFSIDLRNALAETLLLAGQPAKALKLAREALDRSLAPDCQYAWGQADGLHYTGVAHFRLNEHELARQRLSAALQLRERLSHARTEETRKALELVRKSS